jgi:hypothetical protein
MKINIWLNEEFLEPFYSFVKKEHNELPDTFEYFLTTPGPYQVTKEDRINIVQVLISFDEYIRLRDF